LRRLARRGSPELCLAEGFRAVAAAVAAGAEIHELYLSAGEAGSLADEVEACGAQIFEVDPRALAACTPHNRSDGILATVVRPSTSLASLEPPAGALLVVAVGIERPGNLGTIVRTACAAAVDRVVVADPCTDIYHPEVIRGSVGTVFHARPVVSESAVLLGWLARRRFRIVVTTPDGDVDYTRGDYRGDVAIVVGSERHGLSEAWLERAEMRVAIPMPGAADSLNVAVASGVVLFQAVVDRGRARSSSS
jgi:TrmH family RNA methyltransferase